MQKNIIQLMEAYYQFVSKVKADLLEHFAHRSSKLLRDVNLQCGRRWAAFKANERINVLTVFFNCVSDLSNNLALGLLYYFCVENGVNDNGKQRVAKAICILLCISHLHKVFAHDLVLREARHLRRLCRHTLALSPALPWYIPCK